MQRVHQSASRDRQPEVLLIERGDFAEGQTELRMKDGGGRHCPRAHLRRGRAQRIRCLQGMPALHPPTTRLTVPDVDLKFTDDRPYGRQVFLILRRDSRFHDRAGTLRTHTWKRRIVPDWKMSSVSVGASSQR